MKTDYPELEGKEIGVKGLEIDLIAIGVSYHVGITLVDKNNLSNKIYCLNAKLHRGKCSISKSEYRKIFYYMVKAIRKGVIDFDDYRNLFFSNRYGEANQNCAFE